MTTLRPDPMAHTTHSPTLADLKLRNNHGGHRHASGRNKWLAADRSDRRRQIGVVGLVLISLAAGGGLLLYGLSR